MRHPPRLIPDTRVSVRAAPGPGRPPPAHRPHPRRHSGCPHRLRRLITPAPHRSTCPSDRVHGCSARPTTAHRELNPDCGGHRPRHIRQEVPVRLLRRSSRTPSVGESGPLSRRTVPAEWWGLLAISRPAHRPRHRRTHRPACRSHPPAQAPRAASRPPTAISRPEASGHRGHPLRRAYVTGSGRSACAARTRATPNDAFGARHGRR